MHIKQHATEEIKRDTMKYLETNEHGAATHQHSLHVAEAVLRGRFRQTPTSRSERSLTHSAYLCISRSWKEEEMQPKVGRRKAITKIRTERNDEGTIRF